MPLLGNVEIYQAESLFTCEAAGRRLSLYQDLNRLEQEMLRLSPDDKKEILSFISAIRAIEGIMGVGGEQNDRYDGFLKTVQRVPALIKYLKMSTGELSEKFQHPTLKEFMTCTMGRDFGAIALLVTCATFCSKNGAIPQGGSAKMAQRMAKRFTDLGGTLLLKKKADKICTRGNKATAVHFTDGSELTADYIVCAIEPEITFHSLMGRKLPTRLKKQYADPKLKRFSAYQSAFSCSVSNLDFHGDFIFELPPTYQKLLNTKRLILREFSHEPTFAPAGKTILQTLTFCDGENAKEWISLRRNKAAYRNAKLQLAEILETAIAEKFPRLRGDLHCLDVWTPATYERYIGSKTGSFMSFVLPKNYLPTKLKSTVTGLKNVLLASQWQQSPGGLPTAAEMGKYAAAAIEKKERTRAHANVLTSHGSKRKKRAIS